MKLFDISRAVKRAWNSPTITTWASFAGRFLSVLLVLPLALRHLPPADVAAWQLFGNVILIGAILDLGLSPTFSRVVSLVLGGMRLEAIGNAVTKTTATATAQDLQSRWENVSLLLKAGRTMYAGLAVSSMLILGVGGSLALAEPLSKVTSPPMAWISWGIVLLTAALGVWNSFYTSYLLGIEKVALLRRWEAITSIAQVFTASLILYFGGGLFELILTNQLWAVVGILRNAWLCRVVIPHRFTGGWLFKVPAPILRVTWPPMWRSGIGVLTSQGVVYASGFIYAQWTEDQQLASFLLAQRIMLTISQFSQAPFYSKLPYFARLYAEDDRTALLFSAQQAMRRSYWILVLGVVAVGLFLQPSLRFIDSKVEFVSPLFWSIYCLAVFVERFGAMHMQLYSLTNRIIWHIANGVTGSILLVLLIALYPVIGILAFPAAMLTSYLLIYTAFSVKHSYRHFDIPLNFEINAAMKPVIALLGILGSLLLTGR